ncbi:MAG: oligosaccharide flippase family protein [Chitinophagaceae bacterium]|nr:oligosaccharide flippase family protein [Chitinophagaceae bacterium]
MKVVRQVYIYFGTYFFNAALSFALVSILTRHLSPYDYGVINLYTPFLVLLAPFISGGVIYPLSVEYFKRDQKQYGQFFKNAQVIPFLSLLLFTIICIVLARPLSNLLKVTPFWVCILPVTAWFIFTNEVSMMIARSKDKPWYFAGFSLGKNLLEIIVTLLMVLCLKWHWEGRLASASIAPVLFGLFSFYLYKKWKLLQGDVSVSMVKSIFLMSVPFIFERLSVFILSNSDRYFIDKFDLGGTKEVGFYGLGGQIASIVQIVILSVTSAYNPAIFKWLSEKRFEKAFKLVRLYLFAITFFILLFIIGLPVVYRFFISDEFSKGQYYSTYLIVAYGFWAVYSAFLPYFLFYNEGKKVLFISISGMVLSLLLNAILVPRIGATGALYTSVAVYFTMAILSIFLSKPKWKLNEL